MWITRLLPPTPAARRSRIVKRRSSENPLSSLRTETVAPTAKNPGTYANVADYLTELRTRLAGQADSLPLELVAELSSLGQDILFDHDRSSWKCPC